MSEKISQTPNPELDLSQEPALAEKNRQLLEQDAAFKKSQIGLETYMDDLATRHSGGYSLAHDNMPTTYPQQEIVAVGNAIAEGGDARRSEIAGEARDQYIDASNGRAESPSAIQMETEVLDRTQKVSSVGAYAKPQLYTSRWGFDRPEALPTPTEGPGVSRSILDSARKDYVREVNQAMKEEYNRTHPDARQLDAESGYIHSDDAKLMEDAGITFAGTAQKLDDYARTPEEQQAKREENKFLQEYYGEDNVVEGDHGKLIPVEFHDMPARHNERIANATETVEYINGKIVDLAREAARIFAEKGKADLGPAVFARVAVPLSKINALETRKQELLKAPWVGVKVKHADGTSAAPQEARLN